MPREIGATFFDVWYGITGLVLRFAAIALWMAASLAPRMNVRRSVLVSSAKHYSCV